MKKIKCESCDEEYTPIAKIDPCFKSPLPGARFACCGHGNVEKAYVDLTTDNGFYKDLRNLVRLKGQDAIEFFSLIEKNRDRIQNPTEVGDVGRLK